ncbi:hypothetical protein MASR2M74_00580 [Paracoccaceae bacterium]
MLRKICGAIALALTCALAMPAAAQEAEVLHLVNAARAAKGCKPLTMNKGLAAAALSHARSMSERNFFGHTSPNGASVGKRASKAGYNWGSVAENISAGWTTPEKVVSEWMGSSGHRKNILTCKFKDAGVAMVYDPNDKPIPGQPRALKYYWVMTFGR